MFVGWIGTLLACLWLAVAVGCEQKQTPAPPRSNLGVVAHSPAVGVIIRDLGRVDMVVGRHGHDMVLPKTLPVIGSQDGFDYEALLRVQPTHIVTQWGSRELPGRLTELANANGWKLLDTRLLSLTDLRADSLVIDAFLCEARQVKAPSAECTALIDRMDKAWSRRGDGFQDLGRVLLMVSASPPSAFGPGSCHQEILERIGGVPAIRDGNAYIELDAEKLLRIAPDVIVLVSPRGYGVEASDETKSLANAKLDPLRSLAIPAARDGKMVVIDDPLSQLPSTSMIGFAEELARVLEKMRSR
jgi:ABC-type hemin transport system substrate-binding protein